MKTRQRLLAAGALCLILAVPGLAQAQYTFTTIDVPAAVRTSVNRNTSNALAGEYDAVIDEDFDVQTHGFIMDKHGFTTIDVPDATYTTVYGINPRGETSGYFVDEDYVTHGFYRSKDGVFTTIDPPGSVHTFVDDINARGDVLGVYRDVAGTRHGFVWSHGAYTTFDVPGAGGRNGGTVPLGMNDHGDIVGDYTTSPDGRTLIRHGFVLSDGVYTTLDVPGAIFTVATGINNDGVIVGAYQEQHILHFPPPFGDILLTFQHGYVLIDGVYTTIDVGRPYYTAVLTINAEGQIAGNYVDGVTHGFVGTPEHH
jgi:uncharacterized membrane protein